MSAVATAASAAAWRRPEGALRAPVPRPVSAVLALILSHPFSWFHMAPLSRGSARRG